MSARHPHKGRRPIVTACCQETIHCRAIVTRIVTEIVTEIVTQDPYTERAASAIVA